MLQVPENKATREIFGHEKDKVAELGQLFRPHDITMGWACSSNDGDRKALVSGHLETR
jgi:hypothetical protein